MSVKIKDNTQNSRLPNLIQYYEGCNKSEGKSHETVSWYSANIGRV